MSKQFWGVIVVIFLVFVGIFAFSGKKTGDVRKGSGSALTNHVIGNGKAGVTLVEYGDYQCPFCGRYYPTLKQVQTEFNDQIIFQFRNFPLTNLHPNAFAAARAAEAAGLQNKYWQMHDALYATQTQWSSAGDSPTYFKQYAQQLGLNVPQFVQDFASSKVNDLINADYAEGTKLQVGGTPTFFLNGKKIDIGNSTASFEKVIKEAVAKKTPTGSGTTSQTPATKPNTTDDTNTPATPTTSSPQPGQ